ncbi:hypothetical protein CN934_13560 [Ensifer sp. MMN_5]|nr:hypothetical protein CN934_13560 [Ensifer sp. MMN_5]PND26637.1 hypothetical protein CN933_17025 [Sinorhizobium sp. M4_45]
MFPLIAADQWTKTSSSSKGYSDLGASHKTRGAVEYSSEGCNLSSPYPCARHRDESSAASAAREAFFQPKDLVWLDSCDEHRSEGINKARRASKGTHKERASFSNRAQSAATAKRKGHPAPPDGPFSMCCSRYCCTTTRALRPGRTRE